MRVTTGTKIKPPFDVSVFRYMQRIDSKLPLHNTLIELQLSDPLLVIMFRRQTKRISYDISTASK